MVNSSFFGVGRRVSNVETAVNLLGMLRVRALVLREQIFTVFSLPRPIEYFSAERLWHRSLRVAELARQISRAEGQSDDRPDQAFTAGLLHDAGVLLLARLRPEFAAIMRTIHDERRPNVQVEMELLNVTHAEVGAYLLNLWGLPLRIVEAVALHHEPSQVSYDGPCAVTAVHVADALLSEAEETTPDSVSRMMSPRLDLAYLQRIGLEHRIDRWRSCALEITQLAEEVPA